MSVLVVFSHGKETGPNGRKITQLRDIAHSAGAQTVSIDYTSTMDPSKRVQILLRSELPAHEKLILVGSSMGGYVSTHASQSLQPDGLLLMAPAFGLPDYPESMPKPSATDIVAIHGWQDDVVPVHNVIQWAKMHDVTLVLVSDDHSLHNELPTVGQLLVQMISKFKTTDECI